MAAASGHPRQVDTVSHAAPSVPGGPDEPEAAPGRHGLFAGGSVTSGEVLAALSALAVLAVIVLGVTASTHSSLLLAVDEPVLNFLVDHRITPVTWLLLSGTLLGGNAAVVPMAVVAAWAVRDRSRAVAVTVVAVMAARLVVEFAVKAAVDRPRPDVDTLATYSGSSFPSGHVFGAMAFWGVLPLVVSALTPDPQVRRWTTRFSVVAVVIVALSRPYIGAHYPSDVLAAAALGTALLVAAHSLLVRFGPATAPEPATTPEPHPGSQQQG